MKPMIYIGVKKETVVEARKSILEILSAKVEDKTKRLALTAFMKICNTGNTNISNCVFNGNEKLK
jgi:hypothetical protein